MPEYIAPTPAQMSYADSLISQLEDAQHIDARKYRLRYEECVSWADMSRDIDLMKKTLAEIRDLDRGLG